MKTVLIIISILFIKSICFSQSMMYIKMKDGTTQTFQIDDIRKLTFTGTVGIYDGNKLSNVINTFNLLQNYPNPFNPSTTIEYQIPEAGQVVVNIFDISGQLVKTLQNSFQNSGSYSLSWNSQNETGANVASGIYLLQVQHNKSILVKKLMLIK